MDFSMRGAARQILVPLALAGTLVVNGLANALPINGMSTGALSDLYPVLFKPAGYAFAIWGLIYLLLSIYAGWQALPSNRHRPELDRIGALFLISCAGNTGWLLAWHYRLVGLSMGVMALLLAVLTAIYLHVTAPGSWRSADRWLVRLPFQVYTGWILAATLVNASVLFYNAGYSGAPFGEAAWAVVLLAAGSITAVSLSWKPRDVVVLAVLAWAFRGIAVQQAGHPVLVTAIAAALGVLGAAAAFYVISAFRTRTA